MPLNVPLIFVLHPLHHNAAWYPTFWLFESNDNANYGLELNIGSQPACSKIDFLYLSAGMCICGLSCL